MAKFCIFYGRDRNKTFELRGDHNYIGRSPDNDIQVNDPFVSRKHLGILKKGTKHFIKDMGSKNGTFINGNQIKSDVEIEIKEGVPIVIGMSVIGLVEASLDNVMSFFDPLDSAQELIKSYKEIIICPKCHSIHLVDRGKIPVENKKLAKCAKCHSRFYVEKRCNVQNQTPNKERTPLISYFEKRSAVNRRCGIDRRRKIDINNLPFWVPPSQDIILLFDKEDNPTGYYSEGRRNGIDRRICEDRRELSSA
jgi:predicted Zn finger-like uncharacterized protein